MKKPSVRRLWLLNAVETVVASKRKRVLLISHDVVGQKMAGPGIRYFRLAGELSKHFDVTLAIPNEPDLTPESFELVRFTSADSFPPLIDEHDFIFMQLLEPSNVIYATKQKKTLIYDYYNLIPIEYLGSLKAAGSSKLEEADSTFMQLIEDYQISLRAGQYFICSNDRQADFLLGMMADSRSILPSSAASKTLDQLIGLGPFGLDTDPPVATKKVMRGVMPGIKEDDFVIVWAGGIWDWFDPLSLIRAMAQLKDDASIKLVFMGVQNPNKEVGKMKMVGQAEQLAKELGLEQSVFFLSGWLKFEDRVNYLLEADAGASIHFNTLETRYSFRTRILDHFWAGLPSIVTTGDWFADYIEQNQLGITVPYEDDKAIAAAILELKNNHQKVAQMKAGIARAAAAFTWDKTSRALVEFIEAHQPAASSPQEVLEIAGPHERMRKANEALSGELAEAKEKAKSYQSQFERKSADLEAILTSKRWKLAESLGRLYKLGRKK